MKDFSFICGECGKIEEHDECPYDDNNERVYDTVCCDTKMRRVLLKEAKYLSGVRYSSSLGCNPGEIKKFQKKWPWMKFTPDGRCITENYTERKRVLKARGYTDLQ